MLRKIKNLGGKYKIALLALYALIALLLAVTSITPMSKAEAIVASGYKLFVRGSDRPYGDYLPMHLDTILGAENDYDTAVNLGATYYFYDDAAPGNIVSTNMGRAHLATASPTYFVYEGDTLYLNFAGGQLPRFNKFLLTYANGTKHKIINATPGETAYTITGDVVGAVTITARDISTVHTVNFGRNYYYLLNFNVRTRGSSVDGQTIDSYVSNLLQNYTYDGTAKNAINTTLSEYVEYVGGTSSAINTGNYNITLKPKTKYKWGDGTYGNKNFNWTIKKAAHPNTVIFTNSNNVNYGTNLPITISGNQGGVSYSVINGTGEGKMTGSTFEPSKAGTVTIRATIAESTNYLGTTKDFTLTVNKAAHPNTVVFTNSNNVNYGTNLPITISGNQGGVSYSVINGTGEGKMTGSKFEPSKAGTVTIRATIAESTNYLGTTKDFTLTVNKAEHPNTVIFTNSNNVNYGTNLPITISGNKGGVSYTVINGTGVGTMDGSTFEPSKAGIVTIRATIAESTNYLGIIKDLTVTVNAFNLTQSNVTFGSITNPTFNNKEQRPTPTITAIVGGKTVTLVNGTDFTFSYSANINQGTAATVIITGKGNYKGSASKTFTINQLTVSNSNTVFGTINDQLYTGGLVKPTPSVSVKIDGVNILLSANEYDFSYDNNTVVNGSTNKPTLTVIFKGNYKGTASTTFNIVKSEQNFNFTSSFTSLECFKENTMTFSGSLTSTGARTWSSSDPNIISVDNNGKLTAKNKVGSATITLTIAADNNLKERTITKVISTTLVNGFYIGDISNAETHTVYATLKEAVDAANNGENIMVRGNNTVSEVVDVDAAKNIKIIGENGAKISATGTNGGILNISGTLEIANLTLDGKNINGNSIVKLNGGSLSVYNTSFINGVSSQGGAINVGSNSSLTIDDEDSYNQKTSFIGNSANYGGAIFIADNAAEVKILSGSMSNNNASVLGNAIYTNNVTFELDGSDKTAGITDSIGIGGSGSIKVLGGINHKVSVAFAEPESQLSKDKAYVFSENIDGALLKEHFRVVNSGYTFDGEKVDNSLVLQESKTEVARYLDNNGVWHTFTSLQEAINDAAKLNKKVDILLVQYINDKDNTLNNNIIEVRETIVIPEGANITFGSVVKHTDSSGSDFKYETPLNPTVLKRGDNLTGELICVEQGGSLELGGNTVADVDSKTPGDQPSLGQIIIDGGANFGGNYGIPKVTDDGKGGAGTAETNNEGITAHAPLIVNNGSLSLKEGATLQNNDNNYAKPGEGFGSHNYGGGIRNQGRGDFVMSGGSITNCYSREGGAIININRPEKDGYVDNGKPSVTIQGGTIKDNASQMKGAAIQTIYGGANTVISGGEIKDNKSLYDLGSVSVEEGGSVTVSGGTLIAGGTNENAVYVYNKYSLEDYKNAVTKPFIEGNDPAKLAITNAPIINGKVHLDNSCYVVDTSTDPWSVSNKYYETFIDISGYTGSVLNVEIYGNRPYGQTAVSSTNNFDKIKIDYPAVGQDIAVGDRYGHITEKDGKFTLNYGGYDLNIKQTEANKIEISGECDKNIQKISVDIGGKTVELSVTDGIIDQSIDLSELGLTLLDLKITVDYANGLKSTEKTFDDAVKVILYNKESGVITVPENTVYVDKNGQKQNLISGTLPNEIKIDEDGFATFFIGEEERTVFIGARAETPDPTDETFKGGVKDFDDTSITIVGEVGYEYNLIKDGALISDGWESVINSGDSITFSNLDRDSNYKVVVRKIDTEKVKIPSEYVILPGEGITTLTEEDKNKKSEFEEAYELIKDKMYDGNETPKATSEEIKEVIGKYDILTEDIKNLIFIDEYIKDLKDGFAHVKAEEWKETHEDILTKEVSELVLVDKVITDEALKEYESLNEATQELLKDEFDNLLAKKKALAEKEIIEALKNESTDNVECEKIAQDYIDMINDPNVKELEVINLLIDKAKAALEIRTEYDKILKESEESMTSESLLTLENILNERLEEVLNATKESLEEVKTEAIFDLKMEEAIGLIEKRFDEIAENANTNGITNSSLLEIENIKNQKLTDLIDNSANLVDIQNNLNTALLTLDKEEAKAILKAYLKDSDAQDIKDIVLGNDGSNSVIDALTYDKISEIDKIVADTKLKIEKERAKDVINAYLSEYSTPNGIIIDQNYTEDNGIIDAATTADEIWRLADVAKTQIWLEDVRAKTLAKINNDQNKTKKEEGVNKVIDDAITESNDLTLLADLEELKLKAKEDAINVIINIDRDQFFFDHNEILNRAIISVTKEDLEVIDAALDDLKDNYIIESQEAMDDYRDKLLSKKKIAIIDMIESQKDGSSVDALADQYIETINGLDISGNTELDNQINASMDNYKDWANDAIALEKHKNTAIDYLENDKKDSDSSDTLAIIDAGKESIKNVAFDTDLTIDEQKDLIDKMLEEIEADILLQRQKDIAKKELEETYKVITGKGDLTVELVTEAKAAIDATESIEEINDILGIKIKEFVDSVIIEKDSNTTKEIATDLKSLIDGVIYQAIEDKKVASLVETVKDYNKEVADQRAAEKAEAKKEIDDIVKEIFGENTLTKEVIDLIAFEKKQIDESDYADYQLIIDKTKTKLEVIDYHDKIVEKAKEDGYKGFEDLKEVKDNAIAEIELADDKTDIDIIKDDAFDKLDREEAVVDIKNYISEEDSKFVKDVVAKGENQIDALLKPVTNEQLQEIIIDTKKSVDAERFKDRNPIVREDFDKIDQKHIGAIAAALEDLKTVDADVIKDKLDKEAIENGYTSYKKQLEDIVNKADFESERVKTEDQIKALVRDHDGEKVREILKEELEKIKAEINYEQNFDDQDRDGYKDALNDKLEEAFIKAKDKIEHSQLQQRTENQIIQDADNRVDSAKYSDAQKEEIKNILDKAQEEINKIPHGVTAEEKEEAKAKIEKILDDAKKEMGEVKVVAVSKGDIKPNKEPVSNNGTGDYTDNDKDEFWGIVSNDAGMDGAIKLVIDKTNNDAKKAIKEAAKKDKLIIAEGSQIEGDLTALVEKKEVKTSLDIYLLKDSTKITEFEGKYTVKVLLTPKMRSMVGLQVVYINDDGSVEVFKTEIEDDKYLVFTTAHFSEFIILGVPEYNLWWLIITLSVIIIGEIIAIALILLKKKNKDNKPTNNQEAKVNANAALPLGLMGAVIIPTPGIALCIILGILVILCGVFIAYLLLKKTKQSEEAIVKKSEDNLSLKQDGINNDEDKNPQPTEVKHLNKLAEDKSTKAAETKKINKTSSDNKISIDKINEVKYSDKASNNFEKDESGFAAENILATETVKEDKAGEKNNIRNEKSENPLKAKLAKALQDKKEKTSKSEKAKSDKEVKTKTKTLDSKLNKDKTNTSGDIVKAKKDKETLKTAKIKNEDKVKTQKTDIGEAKTSKVKKATVVPKNNPFYKNNVESVAKTIDIETYEILSEVAAADVSKLMSDHLANQLTFKKTKQSDKTKMGHINVSLLNEFFNDGDTVTIEEICKRNPQFDKKITYLKVLASGVLNKKLEVEADAFSLDAVKMITLVGGKAIKYGK